MSKISLVGRDVSVIFLCKETEVPGQNPPVRPANHKQSYLATPRIELGGAMMNGRIAISPFVTHALNFCVHHVTNNGTKSKKHFSYIYLSIYGRHSRTFLCDTCTRIINIIMRTKIYIFNILFLEALHLTLKITKTPQK